MKRWMSHWLAIVLIFPFIFFPNPTLAEADSSLSPGFYIGWVSFSAGKNLTFNPKLQDETEDAFQIGTFTGRGQVMVTVDEAGMGGVSLVLPMKTHMTTYAKVTGKGASCTSSATIEANSRYVHLKDTPAALGTSFQSPYKPMAAFFFTLEHQSSFGDLGGCENSGQAQLTSVKLDVPIDLSVVNAIQFQVKYQTDTDIGGSCTIPGWVRTYPYEGGKDIYTMQQCNWRAFKNSQTKPKQGWK